MSDQGGDRREYFRMDSNILSWYELPPDSVIATGEVLGRVTKNIGGGGMLVEMDQPLPLATILNLDLKLPGEQKIIKARVRVVRVEEMVSGRYEIGFSFVELNAENKDKILAYIERRSLTPPVE